MGIGTSSPQEGGSSQKQQDIQYLGNKKNQIVTTETITKPKDEKNPRLTLCTIESITNTFIFAVENPCKSISIDIPYLG